MSFLYNRLPSRMAARIGGPAPDIIPSDISDLLFWQKANTGLYNKSGIGLNGIDQQLDAQLATALQTPTAMSFYINCWFKTQSISNRQTLICKGDASTNYLIEYRIIVAQTDGVVSAIVGDGIADHVETSGAVTIDLDTWYFLELAYDYTAETLDLYINTSLIGSQTVTFPLFNSEIVCYVGSDNVPDNRFEGTIDQMGFFYTERDTTMGEFFYNTGAGVGYSDIPAQYLSPMLDFFDFGERTGADRYGSRISTRLADSGTNTTNALGICETLTELNNAVIYRWADQSGNVNDFFRTSQTEQPYLDTVGVTIEPDFHNIYFDSTKTLGLTSGVTQPVTIFLVARLIDNAGTKYLTGTNTAVYVRAQGGQANMTADNNLTSIGLVNAEEINSWMFLFNDTDSKISRNKTNTDIGSIGDSANLEGLYIGAPDSLVDGAEMYVFEIFGYNRALSPSEQNQIWQYLRDKFATW